jgi:tetratricopeptide (TPR) repeat protein/transcriptional regulator with XRE-family HTH domain
MPKHKRCLEALVLFILRNARGWTQRELATALGMEEKKLCRYEISAILSREELDFLVEPLGFPPETVDTLLSALRRISPLPEAVATSPVPLTAEERERIARTAGTVGRSVEEALNAELTRMKQKDTAAAAKREAEALWRHLAALRPPERREMVEAFPVFHQWALAVRLCEASLKAAADKPAAALELAALALLIAEKAPGEERFGRRLQGWCWGHVANARRVATDFDAAGEAFARAWQLWRAGEPAEPGWLPEWLLLSFEASLRRAQRRFSKALELLDQAMAGCGGDPAAMARCLLQKEHVFEAMGDIPAALAALDQAAPHVAASGDSHLLFALRFKVANHLCYLKRFAEAAERLPEIGEMALRQGLELDSLRVGWLGARVAAGLGRTGEAVAGLEQVGRRFTDLKLPYEAALSCLDLALLWLEAGRTAEVRELARALAWIFDAKGIGLEASAALKLFREAALREAATVELARRVIAEIETARRSASLSVRGREGRG